MKFVLSVVFSLIGNIGLFYVGAAYAISVNDNSQPYLMLENELPEYSQVYDDQRDPFNDANAALAQVARVYSAIPDIRSPDSIMNNEKSNVSKLPRSKRKKRVWASIENSAEFVIEDGFKEVLQKDPEQKREWVVLMDVHPHQLKVIGTSLKKEIQK